MFKNRDVAGELLADAVAELAPSDPVVLALPRGGVPLGVRVARRLKAPLDLVMARKIGMPGHSEIAAGAVVDGPSPITLFNPGLLEQTGLREADFADSITRLFAEIETRRARYMPEHEPETISGKTAILVDDGVATGATIRVAIKALKMQNPAAIWIAVPVAPADTIRELRAETDQIICLSVPQPFWAVGAHYRNFDQVSDESVVRMLSEFRDRGAG